MKLSALSCLFPLVSFFTGVPAAPGCRPCDRARCVRCAAPTGGRSASRAARAQGKEAINIQNKGRCPAAPAIVTAPGEIYNVSGSQVYLSCEAVGVPTPVLTWKKVFTGKKMELLPGDRGNLAIQTRGGPEKHEVTGWVLISPVTREEEGSYESHATNSQGQASAVGAIHLVQSLDDIIVETVTEEVEL